MAHTYDLTTLIGKVRLKIGDRDIVPITDAQFSDEEIQVFLDEAGDDILLAASLALEAWASNITDSLKSEKIGDYAYSMDSAGRKIELAKKYKAESDAAPAMGWSSMALEDVGTDLGTEMAE